jgi:ribosomal protein L31
MAAAGWRLVTSTAASTGALKVRVSFACTPFYTANVA